MTNGSRDFVKLNSKLRTFAAGSQLRRTSVVHAKVVHLSSICTAGLSSGAATLAGASVAAVSGPIVPETLEIQMESVEKREGGCTRRNTYHIAAYR